LAFIVKDSAIQNIILKQILQKIVINKQVQTHYKVGFYYMI